MIAVGDLFDAHGWFLWLEVNIFGDDRIGGGQVVVWRKDSFCFKVLLLHFARHYKYNAYKWLQIVWLIRSIMISIDLVNAK